MNTAVMAAFASTPWWLEADVNAQPHSTYGAQLTSFSGFRIDSVGFTAVLSTDTQLTSSSQPMLYDRVLTNVGSHYDPDSGHFTCPDQGLYVIGVSVMSDRGSAYARIYRDDTLLAQAPFITYSNSGSSGCQSATTVVRCEPGARIYCAYSSSNSYAVFTADYNLFYGYAVPNQ